jgi:hypothetical protein
MLSLAVLGGCAAMDRTTGPGQAISADAGEKAFQFRLQAAELREMAKRLELEAQWYAQQFGQDSEQAKRSREMAKTMWATAAEADRLATEHQSQVPHGRVY